MRRLITIEQDGYEKDIIVDWELVCEFFGVKCTLETESLLSELWNYNALDEDNIFNDEFRDFLKEKYFG